MGTYSRRALEKCFELIQIWYEQTKKSGLSKILYKKHRSLKYFP